jgi:hypothetical protein
MIRLAITSAAFDAMAETLPLGFAMYEAKATADGGWFIWLEKGALSRLNALRPAGRGLRMAEIEAARPGRWRGRPGPQR